MRRHLRRLLLPARTVGDRTLATGGADRRYPGMRYRLGPFVLELLTCEGELTAVWYLGPRVLRAEAVGRA